MFGVPVFMKIFFACGLWALSQTALQRNGFTRHELEVRRSQLYANSADLQFRIAQMTNRRHLDVLFKSVRIAFLKFSS